MKVCFLYNIHEDGIDESEQIDISHNGGPDSKKNANYESGMRMRQTIHFVLSFIFV